MNTEMFSWNGYFVHGDVKELDAIMDTHGPINLDKDDIVSVLSSEGENWVTAAPDTGIDEAYSKAVHSLPFTIDKINKVLIGFRFGLKKPSMADMSKVTFAISKLTKGVEIKWGMAIDESLGETFKVVLLVSAKS